MKTIDLSPCAKLQVKTKYYDSEIICKKTITYLDRRQIRYTLWARLGEAHLGPIQIYRNAFNHRAYGSFSFFF